MGREAYMPLFFGDFLAATAEWLGEERALYLLLLGYQWSLGSLPADPEKLCRLVSWDRKLFLKHWPMVATKFQARDGRLVNDRLEQHRARAEEISAKRAAAGAKGGQKTKQMPDRLPEQTESNCLANAFGLLGHPSNPSNPSKKDSPERSLKPLGGEVGLTPETGAARAAPAPTNGATPKGKRPRRGNLAHFVPEDWQLDRADYDWALEQGYTAEFVRRETERFVDHEFASPRSDWTRAWRNWITRDPPGGRHGTPQKRTA
jgi:uncharacterized protein YdaU (DUF1376 family)